MSWALVKDTTPVLSLQDLDMCLRRRLRQLRDWRTIRSIVGIASGVTLDVGAGDGFMGKFLVDVAGVTYLALDSYYVGGFGRRGRDEEAWRVLDIIANAMELPVRTAAIDTCLCLFVLEHVPDPDRLVGEIVRVTKPGGKVVFQIPQHALLHGIPHNYFGFHYFGIEELLRRHGLTIEVIRPYGGFWSSIFNRMVLFWFLYFGHPAYKLPRRIARNPSWIRRLLCLPLVCGATVIIGVLSGVLNLLLEFEEDAEHFFVVAVNQGRIHS